MRGCIDCGAFEDKFYKRKDGTLRGFRCKTCYNRRRTKNMFAKARVDPIYHEKLKIKWRRHGKRRYDDGRYHSYITSSIRNFLYRQLSSARRGYKNEHRDDHRPIVSVTLDQLCEIWQKQGGKCALTGLKMEIAFHSLYSVSIDRIDSGMVGYTPENIQLVCKAMNLAKSTHSNNEMIGFVSKIREIGKENAL